MKQFYLFTFILFTHFSFSQNFTDTKGELQISASGAATYNLPIAIPPSIKSVAPIINLTYSSGVRGGIAGQGWSINSISAISRIATRRDIDGFVDGVDFDGDDKLSLDGQRLLIKTGTYWASGSTYETEFKSNTKIELKIEGTTTYFVVTAPDGSRSWYGSKGSGSLQNSASLNSWYIVHYEDVNGNFIDYNYKTITYKGSSQLYIDTITFSGNATAGITAQNRIAFFYKSARRIERDYLKGSAVYATELLQNIQVTANGTTFKTYTLSHTIDPDLGYERLTKIQEFNGVGEQSNPVVFEYATSPNNQQRTEKGYTNTLAFDKTELAGDFDGDGRLDFVANNQIFRNLFNGNSGDGPINLSFTADKRQLITATTLNNNKINQFQSIVFADESPTAISFKVNNLISSTPTLSYTKTIAIDNSMYNDESLNFSVTYYDYMINSVYDNCSTFPSIRKSNEYLEGDFNGDGLSEVLLYTLKNERYYNVETIYSNWTGGDGYACDTYTKSDGKDCYWINLDPNTSSALGSNGYALLQNSALLLGDKKFVADFNSDGKSDVFVINNDKTYKIISFKQLTAAPWIELEIIGSGILDQYSATKQILFGDFNGDSKADIMLPTSEGGSGQVEWNIYYGNPNPAGGAYFVKETLNIVEYWPDTGSYYNTQRHWSNYYAMDINGDGKSDLVRARRKYYKASWTINNHDTEWQITAYNNNIGVTTGSGFGLAYDSGVLDSKSPDIPIPITSNYKYQGANTDLVLVRGNNNIIEYYQFNKNVDTENRLISVTEASGNIKQTIEYKSMEPVNGIYGDPLSDFYSSNINTSATYPNIEILRNSGNYLVSKLTATINGISKYQDFRYRGMVSNFNYGTVGFIRTTRSSWYLQASDSKIWTTQYNDIALRGANTITWTSAAGVTVFDPIPSSLISTKTNVFATYTKGGGDAVYSSPVQDNITITSPVTSGQTYKASNSITASSIINDDLVVNYQAPQIILKPGFLASSSNNNKFIASPVSTVGSGSGAPNSNSSVYNVLLVKQTIQDHNSGIKTETSFTYDGLVDSNNYYGLEVRNVTKQYSGAALQGTTTIDTEYDNNPTGAGSAYYIGRPKKVNSSKNIYTGDTRTSEESYTYTGSNLTKTEKKGHNTYPLIEEMTYDILGNLLTKTVSAPGAPNPPPARTIVDEYDSTKRFVIKKTDHQLFVTNFTYNNLGQVTQSKDHLGVINDYVYDNWGKLTSSTTQNVSATALTTAIAYAKLSNGGYTATTTTNTDAKTIVQYDVLGRAVITSTKGFTAGTLISKQVVYDGLGRKTKESEPYFTSPGKWTVYDYDYLMRPKKITAHTDKIQTFDYPVGLTTTSNDDGKITTVTVDALGNKTQTTDPGGTVNYIYYANGQLKESDYQGNKVAISIDGWGNKIAMTDPSAGTYTYSYYAFGEIKTETTPNGTTAYLYDNYGRVTEKTINDAYTNSKTTYAYKPNTNLVLSSTFYNNTEGNSITNTVEYDNYNRISKTVESTPYATFTKELSYDTFSRPNKETVTAALPTKSSSRTFKHTYQNGFPWQIVDDINQVVLWQTNSLNERGQLTSASLGNGIAITNSYDQYGYASQFKFDRTGSNAGNVMTLTTAFEPKRGNLNNRTNNLFNWNENFSYDELDRLLTYNSGQAQQETQSYDAKGKITQNNVGTYNYTVTGKTYQNNSITLSPAALSYYENRGAGANSAPKLGVEVAYNTFKSPVTIREKGRDGNYIDYLSFTYNDGNDRSTMFYGGTQGDKLYRPLRKHYSGDGTMEIKENSTTGVVEFVTYVGGDGYSAPVVLKSDGTTQNYLYLHRDYQGTILAITDNTGAIVEKRLFDAWGAILKVQNAAGTDLAGLTILDRGYTGHEHLQSVGLINMNGRLYDPKLHRFLQPDNFIQDPSNTQNYNRYGYVLNNPLKYTDSSGEAYELLVAVGIGVAIALTSYTITALLTDVPFTVGGLVKAAFIGAASAAVTFGIGTAAGTISNFFVRAGVSAVAHGAFQGAMTSISGGKFWSGFAAGALSSIAASAWSGGGSTSSYKGAGSFANSGPGMIAFGTVSGGVAAELTGGNFWQGAATGLVVSGLNHYMHRIVQKIRIHSNADEWLKSGGYDPNANISDMDENARDPYVKSMRKNVYPADILYNDAGDPNIGYDSAISDYGKYENKEVTIYGKAFTTNKDLFLTIMHEGMHAWDYYHGLVSAWGSKSRAITETRAYEMMRYFDNNVFNNGDHSHFYDLYSKIANQSGFSNFSIQSYPIFFNNIQR